MTKRQLRRLRIRLKQLLKHLQKAKYLKSPLIHKKAYRLCSRYRHNTDLCYSLNYALISILLTFNEYRDNANKDKNRP